MLAKKIDEVPAVKVEILGADKCTVRVLFGPKDAVPTFAMRQFELEPLGCTPKHTHPWEHQIVILDGQIELAGPDDTSVTLTIGQVAMVPPDELHQFINRSSSNSAKMLCFVPVEHQQ